MKSKILIIFIILIYIQSTTIYGNCDWGIKQINLNLIDLDIRGSNDVTVAIVDSGIDINNPEFKGKIVNEYNIVENNKNIEDKNGHGTSVASLIAANDDGIGVDGIAPNIKIMPIKIFDEMAEIKYLIKGLEYAVNNGADIVNCSTVIQPPKKGRYKFDLSEFKFIDNYYEDYKNNKIRKIIIENPDVLFIFPAGNMMESNALFPARYKEENIISVGACDKYGDIWKESLLKKRGSNYNDEDVDLLAPGVDVQTIGLNGLEKNTGTSMSAAYVSGVAALIKSQYKDITPLEIKNIIISSVNKKNSLKKKVLSSGILDAYNALEKAKKLIR